MYKGNQVCEADLVQIDIMKKAGWSKTKPEPKPISKPVPNAKVEVPKAKVEVPKAKVEAPKFKAKVEKTEVKKGE